MKMLGEQFVVRPDHRRSADNGRRQEAKGFRYSYDMLGEAATTAKDAERYFAAYARPSMPSARQRPGAASTSGPGISIKLSALHPRYKFAQSDRVMSELLPRVLRTGAAGKKRYDIGLNIDAEEADRLDPVARYD